MSLFSSMRSAISRLFSSSPAHNTIVVRTVEVYLQRSPSNSESDTDIRGVEALTWRVTSGGTEIQSGTTEDSGLIEVQVRGAVDSILELTHEGTTVAQYRVRIRDTGYEPDTELAGVQRRLMQLGYHVGHESDDGDGVDGDMGRKTDKAIMDFQVDEKIDIDGVIGSDVRTRLNDQCGGSAEE